MYQIELSTRAQKDLEKLKKSPLFQSIIANIKLLAYNPFPVQSKKLKNYSRADFRLRIGDYRILYSIDTKHKVIIIAGIFHRQKGYKSH